MNLKQIDLLFDNKLSIIRFYFFLFYCLFAIKNKDDSTIAISSSHRAFRIICKKSTKIQSQYLQDKVHCNKETGSRETFRIFFYSAVRFGDQSDRKFKWMKEM